jgi:hypothetical protein
MGLMVILHPEIIHLWGFDHRVVRLAYELLDFLRIYVGAVMRRVGMDPDYLFQVFSDDRGRLDLFLLLPESKIRRREAFGKVNRYEIEFKHSVEIKY